jgi:transcription elongation GreA/GreB family factor
MLTKKIVFEAALESLNEKQTRLESAFDDAQNALNDDSKSSAGDKHETSRAMVQLEQEKLSSQLENLTKLRQLLKSISLEKKHTTIQQGSLVKTENGYFFISIALGKLMIKDQTVFCLTLAAPMGQAMLNKKIGESISMNGNSILIEDIS